MKTCKASGIALILVLAFLALISVFVVGFFSSATNELSSSSSYAAGISTKQLAETTTSLVMAQIRNGTSRAASNSTIDQNSGTATIYDSWASQPGMIRCFAGAPAGADPNSDPTALYKLYSSDRMVLEQHTGSFLSTSDVPADSSTWLKEPALYTDLNEPVSVETYDSDTATTATRGWRYPIIDPEVFAKRSAGDPPSNLSYPTGGQLPGAEIITDSSLPTERQARMPVRWLYVLKDGSIVSPGKTVSNSGKTVTFDSSGIAPTADNPLVGRIAFWTDDDTCKVNINTAGGYSMKEAGNNIQFLDNNMMSFWDTPRMNTMIDRGPPPAVSGEQPFQTISTGGGYSLAVSQPAAGEFQRYPGHPSTTSLGMVLGEDLSSENIYNLAPRLSPSDVQGKQVRGSNNGKAVSHPDTDLAVPRKYERLFSSVDELLYYPSNKDQDSDGAAKSGQRLRQTLNGAESSALLKPERLDQLRFFLTAHSRSPELNLFGQPRITLWPIWPIFGDDTLSYQKSSYNKEEENGPMVKLNDTYTTARFRDMLTAPERLLAFCSTIGGDINKNESLPYIFQRYDCYSSTKDASINRNKKLFEYITTLTSKPIPGFGGSFSSKYGADTKQIIAEIFDHIRCINLRDSTHDELPINGATVTVAKPNNDYKYAPRGTVVPSRIATLNDAQGFGRFPTISGIAVDFYHAGYLVSDDDPATKKPTTKGPNIPTNPQYYAGPSSANSAKPEKNDLVKKTILGKFIGCFVVLETFNPMQGYSTIDSFLYGSEVTKGLYFIHEIDGLEGFRINAPSSMGPPTSTTFASLQMPGAGDAVNAYFQGSGDTNSGQNTGGFEGFFHTIYLGYDISNTGLNSKIVSRLSNGTTPWKNWYPFQSDPNARGFSGFKPVGTALSMYTPNIGNKPALYGDKYTLSGIPAEGMKHGVFVRNRDDYFNFWGGPSGTGTLRIRTKFGTEPGKVINSYTVTVPPSLGSAPIYPATAPGGWPMPTEACWIDSGGVYRENFVKDPEPKPRPGYLSAPKDVQFSFARRVQWTRSLQPATSFPETNPDFVAGFPGGSAGNFQRTTNFVGRWRQIIQPGDTIRSFVPANPKLGQEKVGGDLRCLAVAGDRQAQLFTPHPYYNWSGHESPTIPQIRRHAHNLRNGAGNYYLTDFGIKTSKSFDIEDMAPAVKVGIPQAGSHLANDPEMGLLQSSSTEGTYPPVPNSAGNLKRAYRTEFGKIVPSAESDRDFTEATTSSLPPTVNGVMRASNALGDFDSGTGVQVDGPYAGKADEGHFQWRNTNATAKVPFKIPYFGFEKEEKDDDAFGAYFSPNRQVPSAVVFGSLLAGRDKQWQTLAFSPNQASGMLLDGSSTSSNVHPGLANPPDHLLLDLFTMPIVEPYAISEPFSTAGKVNMNYPIVPFNYIIRKTAMMAALQPVRLTALSVSEARKYKLDAGQIADFAAQSRFPLDLPNTVRLFDNFFEGTSGGERIFRSATQICEMYLYPKITGGAGPSAPTAAAMKAFWETRTLTADNEREKPYADLYPRLTTKSNTFTVYMRVQSLKKRPIVSGSSSAKANSLREWTEGQDQVLAEYRGAATIERYLDPQDPKLQGTKRKINPDVLPLESLYRYRVIDSKRFQP